MVRLIIFSITNYQLLVFYQFQCEKKRGSELNVQIVLGEEFGDQGRSDLGKGENAKG